jgi:hypothetical protein
MKNELNQYVEFFSQASLEINSTEETSQTRWIQTKKSSSMWKVSQLTVHVPIERDSNLAIFQNDQ